ncbi:hypothetical protein M0802_001487 [Mischocyttarus mexicanus]|nr:hypothetical protein M0802_001487 [Mischocyttarus mexicanus]
MHIPAVSLFACPRITDLSEIGTCPSYTAIYKYYSKQNKNKIETSLKAKNQITINLPSERSYEQSYVAFGVKRVRHVLKLDTSNQQDNTVHLSLASS